jgi:hypothetical protein
MAEGKKYPQTNSNSNFYNSGEKVEDPNSLGWGSELKEASTRVLENRNKVCSNKENENNQVAMSDSEVSFPAVSNGQKKALVTRKNDFLW